MSNELVEIFDKHNGRLVHKLSHYIDIYDRYFARFRNKEIYILEIGISHGGSLQVWKKYFGDKVKIFAVDINPECKKLEDENVKVFIGSQEDKAFLEDLKRQLPKLDIIIDDGGHTMKQQINTFEVLYNHVKDGGVYLCEDTCTSYWYEYGGGLKRKGTFIEYSKNLIDRLYAWQFKSNKIQVDEFTENTNSIHFYDSMVFFERLHRTAPQHYKRGTPSIHHDEDPQADKKTFIHRVIKKLRSI